MPDLPRVASRSRPFPDRHGFPAKPDLHL